MILPGISGSFILLLLGMYTPILAAAKGLELGTLGIFAMGCVVGILTFSHILSWLLRQHRDVTLTFLTGLMVGTLSKIWPWKETLSTRINSAGETVPLLQHNLSPWQFEHVTGLSPWLVTSVVAMIVAIVFVLLLERFGQKD
jgi:putative membrane protein